MELSKQVKEIFEKAEINAVNSGSDTAKTVAIVFALKGVAMALAEMNNNNINTKPAKIVEIGPGIMIEARD